MAFDGKAFGEEVVAATRSFVERSLAPVLARLAAAEKALADAQAALAARPDVEALVVAAVEKAIPRGEPIDLDAVTRGIEDRLAERIAALPKAATAEEVAALIPPPPEPVDVDAILAAAVEKTRAEWEEAIKALPAMPTAEEIAALHPPPKDGIDGKDADPEFVRALVKEAVAALPAVPTPEEVAALVPKGQDGKDGSDGLPGAPGEPGRDGVDGKDGRDGIDGKDGDPGRDGEKGLDGAPGRDGIDGKNGVGLAGVLRDHEGCVVFTLTDGAIVKLGKFDGRDGEPGKDGAPGRDVDPEFVRAAIKDEVQRQVTAPLADAYKGVWKPGVYKRGDVVTWGGSLFIAAADTEAKPESAEDWKLAVKRGRDGKDGETPKPPTTVKLK
jgi:hypothetical protein